MSLNALRLDVMFLAAVIFRVNLYSMEFSESCSFNVVAVA